MNKFYTNIDNSIKKLTDAIGNIANLLDNALRLQRNNNNQNQQDSDSE